MQKYVKYVKMISDIAQRILFEHVLYVDQNEVRVLEILAENHISVEEKE